MFTLNAVKNNIIVTNYPICFNLFRNMNII